MSDVIPARTSVNTGCGSPRYFAGIMAAFLLSLGSGPASAYDDVRIESVVPFVTKKVSPALLRLDGAKSSWILDRDLPALQKISPEGRVAAFINPGKKKAILFEKPVDFDFLPDGRILLADAGLDRLAVIGDERPDASGTPTWKRPVLIKVIPFDGPACLAVSREGFIAAAGTKGNAIRIFSPAGVPLHQLYAPVNEPFESVTRMAFSNDGVLWVLDGSKGRLHRFSADRKWIGAVDSLEGARAFAVDEFGFAYVTVSKGRWKEVTPDGNVTGTFGISGRHPGEMLDPVGVAIVDNRRVLVLEAGNLRIQSFLVTNRQKHARLPLQPAAWVHVEPLWAAAEPARLAVAARSGVLLIGGKKNLFQWLSDAGRPEQVWKREGRKTAWFDNPAGAAHDPSDALWIADEGDHTLKKVNESGQIVQTIGGRGKQKGGLKGPSHLAIRPDGSFVVADRDASRVQVLNSNGMFLFAIDGRGKAAPFSKVTGLAASADRIVVADDERKSLVFFDASGKKISDISNKEGKAPVWQKLAGVACDPEGRFYVLDETAKRVRIFGAGGQFIGDFSAPGRFIAAGPGRRVAILGEKDAALYAVNTVPRAPSEVTVRDQDGDLRVSWEKTAAAEKYRVYRSSNEADFQLLVTTAAPPFVDVDVVPGESYRYAIAGVNAIGLQGGWEVSNPLKATRRKNVSLVSINAVSFQPVFAAAFKYYVKKPFGTVQLQNFNDAPFRDVKLSIALKRYTDFPTEIVIPSIGPGQKLEVPVTLTFNANVLELTENTPLQADVRVSYFEDNAEKSASRNAPITVYSRNTISWADKSRLSSFVTPRDAPVIEFSRQALKPFIPDLKAATIGKPLAKTILFFETMSAAGIAYAPDPKAPYAMASAKPEALDYVQFPRETLRRKTGDCDDTTALLAALLQSIGVEVAFVDTPGHIFLMANLEETDASNLGLPPERFVEFQGTYWVPVETTRLGRGFMEAWQAAISHVKTGQSKNKIEFIALNEAAQTYPPVTLVEDNEGAVDVPIDRIRAAFTETIAKLQKEKFDYTIRHVKERIQEDPTNSMLRVQLAMVYVEGGNRDEARKILTPLLADASAEVKAAAHNNLGNLAYIEGMYAEAAKAYTEAAALSPGDGGIKVNLARVAWRSGDRRSARTHLTEARSVLKEWQEYASDLPAELLPK